MINLSESHKTQSLIPFKHTCFHKEACPSFDMLLRQFPSKSMFVAANGLPRPHDQRPHDRFSLSFEHSVYKELGLSGGVSNRGVIQLNELGKYWQNFIKFLCSKQYQNFLSDFFEIKEFDLRFEWHIMHSGDDLSPHLDSGVKLGSQLFYFNTAEDWNLDWGGNTNLLGKKLTPNLNPEEKDFKVIKNYDFFEYPSLLFQNSENSWHSVSRINAPVGFERRLFAMIVNRKGTAPKKKQSQKHSFGWLSRGLKNWV